MEKEKLIEIIWNYHHMNHKLESSDCIVVLGSHDTRVAKRRAEVILEGYAPFIVFSGGLGKITGRMWRKPEAQVFSEIAAEMGVPKSCMLIEDKSTNTGENVLFVKRLLEENQIRVQRLIAVNKPYMERRTFATFKKQWPEVEILVTSPQVGLEEYLAGYSNGALDRDDIINVMVGDLQRIKTYPELGFQIPQDIPKEVWDAYLKLLDMGYTKYIR